MLEALWIELFTFTLSLVISFSIGQGKQIGAFSPALLYQSLETGTRGMVSSYLELECAESDSLGVGLSSPGHGFFQELRFVDV